MAEKNTTKKPTAMEVSLQNSKDIAELKNLLGDLASLMKNEKSNQADETIRKGRKSRTSKESEDYVEDKKTFPRMTDVFDEEKYNIELSPTKQITLVCLSVDTVILKNDNSYNSDYITFEKYKEKKVVPFSRVMQFVQCEKNINFLRSGLIYIDNPSAVFQLGLWEDYKYILNEKEIDNLFDLDLKFLRNIMKNATPKQCRLIFSHVLMNMLKNPSLDIDANFFKIFKDIMDIDVLDYVQSARTIINYTIENRDK